jgi:pimeloyl-ACP methyl ester carboxylesterase
MPDDPLEPSDELPSALDAFVTDEADRRAAAPYAAARAGALLSLVPPPRARPADDHLADEEARELLGVVPVAPFELEPGEATSLLANLGDVGKLGADFLSRPRAERSGAERGPNELKYIARTVRPEFAAPSDKAIIRDEQRSAASALFPEADQPDQPRLRGRESAAQLIIASLLDEDPIVRVAAGAATLRIDERNLLAEAVLSDAATDQSIEVAEVARAALTSARRYEHRRIEIEEGRRTDDPVPDSVLVHGTWARRGHWWRPSGDLHAFLRDENVFPHLYARGDSFNWSGYFSFRTWAGVRKDWQRTQAGSHLAWWAERRLAPPPDVIGHSYGGSIAMLATVVEKAMRGLVLLSPAVHRNCLPNPNFYEQILVARMPLDLVLLVDRSKPQLLRDMPRVIERKVPRHGRSGHFGTHDPAVWRANRLEEYVRDEWLKTLSDRT